MVAPVVTRPIPRRRLSPVRVLVLAVAVATAGCETPGPWTAAGRLLGRVPVALAGPAARTAARPPLTADGLPPVVRRVETSDPVVFVTIDDGWAQDPTVLPFLASHHLAVTAFLIGGVARRTAPYWQALVAQGGVVEDHTETHPAMARRPLDVQQAQVCGPLDDYQRLFGRRPTLFRPPYGSMDANTVVAAGRCGLHDVVLWDVTIDRGRLRRATAGPVTAGDIVLLHWGPGLAGDLQRLVEVLNAARLRTALLENYLP
ncbi:MAG: polysaccharide deacetylase family protein [Actinobacteria bacterium]|nr:polysaccharide deacetylase family protein [Actinomycetota bacterium]